MDQPYHNSPPSTFLDLNEEQPQEDHLFNLNTQISSPFSLSSPLMINNPPQDQGEFFYREPQISFQLQAPLEADHKIFSSGGSCDHEHQYYPRAADQSESENSDLKLTIWKNDHTQDSNEKNHTIMMSTSENFDADSVKWSSSKMRMMRKMITTTNPDHQTISTNNHHTPINFTKKYDHHQAMKNNTPLSPFAADHSSTSSSNNNNNNGAIRVCADCNTTKTPLWRSGPRGPKSLCNACGIRQRKARRAMAAAAAAANGTIVAVDATSTKVSSTKVKNKEKKKKVGANGDRVNAQFKKRCKLTSQSRGQKKKLLCFEDLRISISKNSAFQRVFPQDEKDAAILLMALSYGLVHG